VANLPAADLPTAPLPAWVPEREFASGDVLHPRPLCPRVKDVLAASLALGGRSAAAVKQSPPRPRNSSPDRARHPLPLSQVSELSSVPLRHRRIRTFERARRISGPRELQARWQDLLAPAPRVGICFAEKSRDPLMPESQMRQSRYDQDLLPQGQHRSPCAEELNRQAAAERACLRQGVEWIEDRRSQPCRSWIDLEPLESRH
jgi:hypothetical protein